MAEGYLFKTLAMVSPSCSQRSVRCSWKRLSWLVSIQNRDHFVYKGMLIARAYNTLQGKVSFASLLQNKLAVRRVNSRRGSILQL